MISRTVPPMSVFLVGELMVHYGETDIEILVEYGDVIRLSPQGLDKLCLQLEDLNTVLHRSGFKQIICGENMKYRVALRATKTPSLKKEPHVL